MTALPATLALLAAVDPTTVYRLAHGDRTERVAAASALAATGDPEAGGILRALLEGRLYAGEGLSPAIEQGDVLHDVLTGKEVPSEAFERVAINNQLRRVLERALSALALASPAPAERLAAARALQEGSDADALPAIDAALSRERDPEVREALGAARAVLGLAAPDRAQRLSAIEQLARSGSKRHLVQRLAVEKDPEVAQALRNAIQGVDTSLRRAELVGLVFGGLSLASILLLAALGLAITFGLMGVINMAHGELLMIGAYATWAVQSAFRAFAPGAFNWYLAAALPVSFAAAAAVGVVLELLVVRKLYGRPLETLLATWGASLILVQTVRTFVGAQNVEVANPAWMSGGVNLLPGLVLPWNRIAILAFSGLVLLIVWALLTRTRLGLLVRAVTQDRQRAAGLGVATPRIDLVAFGLGSGIAGLGGCALSQIGNVGPELGQGFIVDSFMVVVLGGVGQLAGTVLAATGLGLVNKFLEPTAGAVMAKIAVLTFVIFFLQRRPQGLFALKGRALDGA